MCSRKDAYSQTEGRQCGLYSDKCKQHCAIWYDLASDCFASGPGYVDLCATITTEAFNINFLISRRKCVVKNLKCTICVYNDHLREGMMGS